MRKYSSRRQSTFTAVLVPVLSVAILVACQPSETGEVPDPLGPAGPAERGSPPQPDESTGPTIADLAWISGAWAGEAFGALAEAYWTPPSGRTMLGSFRLIGEGETVLVEFLTIHEADEGIDFRYLHFNAEMEVQETEPLYFRLTDLGEHRATFESPVQTQPKRLIYSLTSEGDLNVLVESEVDGEIETLDVRLRRVSPRPGV